MPVTVIIGGQYGSEGKGKVAKCLAEEMGASIAIRCGGPNSGHTVVDSSGQALVFRQLPTPCLLPGVVSVLCAGSYIDPAILLQEIKRTSLDPSRVHVDPKAVIITDEFRQREQTSIRKTIGSTASGTGAAIVQRIRRSGQITFARDVPTLRPYVKEVTTFLRRELEQNKRVVLEGTQGFGLSLLHSPDYPYVTSRDTTAAAFVAEAALSPIDVDDVVLVLRAFPIRVPGNSGPLPNEIDWKTLTREAGSTTPLLEYTSVTHTVRRVARFDPEVVLGAIRSNRPTRIVLNHVDFVDEAVRRDLILTPKAVEFVEKVEATIGRKIDLVGTSPSTLFPKNLRVMKNYAYLAQPAT